MKEQKFKGPYWMKEPLPESDRVKYLTKENVLERLKNGEIIRFIPDCWMKFAPKIYFEKDNRLKAIRRQTFDSLVNKNIIKQMNLSKFKDTKWILSPKEEK